MSEAAPIIGGIVVFVVGYVIVKVWLLPKLDKWTLEKQAQKKEAAKKQKD
jgi:uncharacterized membrane protein